MKTKRLNTGPISCAKWLAVALFFCGFGVSYGFEPTDSYTYGFWLGNPRLVNSTDDYRFVVQTDRYGLLINVGQARIERLGVARPATTQRQALRAGSDWISALPDVVPSSWLEHAGRRYQMITRRVEPVRPDRYLSSNLRQNQAGQYLQHFRIVNVGFVDEDGRALDDIAGELEFACWPDFVVVSLHLRLLADADAGSPRSPLRVGLTLPAGKQAVPTVLAPDGKWSPAEEGSLAGSAAVVVPQDDAHPGIGLVFPLDSRWDGWQMQRSAPGDIELSCDFGLRSAFEDLTATFLLIPADGDPRTAVAGIANEFRDDTIHLDATVSESGRSLPVRFDPGLWAHVISLDMPSTRWDTERVQISISNSDSVVHRPRVIFEKNYNHFQQRHSTSGIVGFSSLLVDPHTGDPLGFPIQLSKNWHIPRWWTNAITVLQLEPGEESRFEYQRPNAVWADVPSVSHAQLSLIGWGGYGQWDQVAVGNFGEQICYDPYLNLRRSFVGDIRPLLVWGLGSTPDEKWMWTENVGGAAFLVLETVESRKRQAAYGQLRQKLRDGSSSDLPRIVTAPEVLPQAQKTLYHKVGPVLSEVTYAGNYAEGAVDTKITVHSFRSDDYFRAIFHIRYDVRKDLDFKRLAFFQLGADHYNDNLFERMAHGNVESIIEEWRPPMGEDGYSRRARPIRGDHPWFALLGAQPERDDIGFSAWPNRALIIHDWQARLGGKTQSDPYYSVRGTNNGTPCAAVELSPPPGLDRLRRGDFVEAWIELAILPKHADDYYGPNKTFKHLLEQHPDSASLVHEIARGQGFEFQALQGTIQQRYLPIIAADQDQAEFVLVGGQGYLPITVTNLGRPGPIKLEVQRDGAWESLDSTEDGKIIRQTHFDAEDRSYSATYTFDFSESDRWHFRLNARATDPPAPADD